MAETQSTVPTTTEATAPTGDIKVFIDTFNKDFDDELKKLVDTQQNYKNVYADAIKISTPKSGPWPNDPKVVTIGDLFKYTFPDIESDKVVQPPDYELGDSPEGDKWENRKGWEKDLKYSKDEKIKKMYQTISSGINSNLKIQIFQDLKKPGITNPSLWSPGQYYFDVFMMKFFVNRSTKPSSFLKDPYQSITDDKGNVIEPGKEDFVEFTDAIYSLSSLIVSITNINIGFTEKEDKSSLFPSLQTQYKSGLWSELVPEKNVLDAFYKDKEFDSRRGDFDSGQPKTFIGYYEHILLYKAFIQAGDNYKSVVLPLRNPETPAPAPEVATKPIVNLPQEVGYTFNVEKKDSFVIVGGSMSGVEFTIVPNDGTQYIIETPSDIFGTDEDLDPEYLDGDFTGDEERIVKAEEIKLNDTYEIQRSKAVKEETTNPANIPAGAPIKGSPLFKVVLNNAGYKPGSLEYEFALTIATKEGWAPNANNGKGSRSYRNNNPGNLDYSSDLSKIDPNVTREPGSGSRFARFSTAELGAKALIEGKIKRWASGKMPVTSGNQSLIAVSDKYKKGTPPTIVQFMYTYAPPNENNTEGYLASILSSLKKVNPNITRTSKVKDYLSGVSFA
jgi:hypothetical protein